MTKREFAEVVAVRVNGKVHEVNKNGNQMTGIIRDGKQAAAVAYIDKYYDEDDLEGAVKYAKSIIDVEMDEDINIDDLLRYESVKDKLRTMLVNVDWQDDNIAVMQLDDTDLGVAFYVAINNEMSFRVTKDQLKEWGVTTSELWLDAKKDEPILQDMAMALFGGTSMNLLEDSPSEVPSMMILTNKEKFRGASAIVGHLREIADVVGGSFYVLPSSVHEVLIVPADNPNELPRMTQMVVQVNETAVTPEERLSDHAYFYNAKKALLHA